MKPPAEPPQAAAADDPVTRKLSARHVALAARRRTARVVRRARGRDWLRMPERPAWEVGVKPPAYVPIYAELLAPLRRRRCAILELGVFGGDSLEMWRDCFPRATVVGVDLKPPALDLGDRVHIVYGDQTDAALMAQIRERHAPGGFDLIVDDASHMGITTARSLQALFERHLRPGGLYVIEDWGTGYLPAWFDGGPVAETVGTAMLDRGPVAMHDVAAPIPLPSHDVGMVGVVKRLVDHVARGTLVYAGAPVDAPLNIASMQVYDGIVALRKASA